MHQINGGELEAIVVGNSATIMFELTGPTFNNLATNFRILLQAIPPGGSSAVDIDDVTCSTIGQLGSPFTGTCDLDTGEDCDMQYYTWSWLSVSHYSCYHSLNLSVSLYCLLYIAATGHGKVTLAGFTVSGRYGIQIQHIRANTPTCDRLAPRRFEFDI